MFTKMELKCLENIWRVFLSICVLFCVNIFLTSGDVNGSKLNEITYKNLYINNFSTTTTESPTLASTDNYKDNQWQALDQRTIPSWYDDAKLGVFIHWGLYSVPSFGISNIDVGYGEWFLEEIRGRKNSDYLEFMNRTYPSGFKYQDFVKLWKAEFFNATQWADLVEASGAKYVVVTTKHHDGFTLWPSAQRRYWNSVEVGPKRDIIGELASALENKSDVHLGLYYSLYEWYNAQYLLDKGNNFTTKNYVQNIVLPQLYDIVQRYRPHYIWADGDWEASMEYWGTYKFLKWLYNDSPVRDNVLVNDRWGIEANCRHGDVKTCGTDRFNPKMLQSFKWENAMTIDRFSWGFRRNAVLDDYLTMDNITALLAETISCGGNLLINIGPAGDGSVSPIYEERLRQLGLWMKSNGEGIYGTHPWRVQNDTEKMQIWYTSKRGIVFAIVLDWPINGVLVLKQPLPTARTHITLLGYTGAELDWFPYSEESGIIINLSSVNTMRLPFRWAYIFKMTYVE